jgi:hypothetical protein
MCHPVVELINIAFTASKCSNHRSPHDVRAMFAVPQVSPRCRRMPIDDRRPSSNGTSGKTADSCRGHVSYVSESLVEHIIRCGAHRLHRFTLLPWHIVYMVTRQTNTARIRASGDGSHHSDKERACIRITI